MKKLYYFSHDVDARSDRKMIGLRMKHQMTGVGIYWCILEMLYAEGGFMPMECERIAFELQTDCEIVKSVLEDFGLFIINDGMVSSESVLDRIKTMQNKSQKASESASKRWLFKDKDANAMPTQCEGNANKVKKSKVKKSKIKINMGTDVPRTLFKPPEQKEVQDYITAQGWDVDADRFVAFYESKGWMIGKNKMKNWKAAVKTWQYSNNPKSKELDDLWKPDRPRGG